MACSIVRSFKACMPPFSKAAKEDLRSKVELLLLLLPTARAAYLSPSAPTFVVGHTCWPSIFERIHIVGSVCIWSCQQFFLSFL